MKYQTMPPLATDDRDALERSIRTHGIQVPIIVDENGDVIDGHHRKEIAERIGIVCPVIHELDKTEAEKIALSISLNKDRRQLTAQQKREVIAASIKAAPEVTDREHARRTGSSPSTVGAVRDDLESAGEVSKLDTRRDPRGYEQPASRPVVSIKHKTTEETTETFDADTGELIQERNAAIIEAVDSDQQVQDARYMANFYKAVVAADALLRFDPDRVGRLARPEDFVTVEQHRAAVQSFAEKVRGYSGGLRVIQGGRA